MKKLSLLAAVLLMSLSGINAQQNNLNVRHAVGEDVPMAVLATIEAGYPGLNIHQHLVAPVPKAKKEKKLVDNSSELLQPYYAMFKGRDYWKKEIYNKKGGLLYSSERIRNIALPREVYTFIGREYNGWGIKKNVAIKVIEAGEGISRDVVYYKVLLQNGKKKQWVQLDERGNIYARRRS